MNGVTTDFYLNGSDIVTQISGNDRLDFAYNEAGNLYGFFYQNMLYLYVRNGQGDITAILDDSGDAAVYYEYDTWGNVTKITDNTDAKVLGKLNPFRYRGYYLDNESGLYYLQSRYYDSVTCRFLNANTITDGGAGVLGYNLFIYAANNPISYVDSNGHNLFVNVFKGAVKWVADKIVKPVVKTIKKVVGSVSGTYTAGYNVSASFGTAAVGGQISYSIDTSGGIAVQWGGSAGLTTSEIGGSISAFGTITDAPEVSLLEGDAVQVGGL